MKYRLLLVGIALLLLAPPGVEAQDAVSDLLGRINNLRQSQGLHSYSLNGALTAAAQNHASWMASTGQVSHNQPDGSTPSSRATRAGYGSTWVSENIYMGTNASAATAWQFWVNSAIHYRGLVSANNRDIGIAAVTGEYGTAFVLVFGNPGGAAAAPPVRVPGREGGGAASGPPPYVVGVDNLGNIMHEIQPGHTLGHIVFMYGYGWDDLQRVRDLNGLTEEEGRNLSIGGVLLIPPWDGTYTPTPGDPAEAAADGLQVTEAAPDGDRDNADEGEAESQLAALIAPTATATESGPVATSAVVPEWVVETMIAVQELTGVSEESDSPPGAPVNAADSGWTAATMTPTPGPSPTAAAVAALPDEVDAPVAEAAALPGVIRQARDTSPWLIAAVILQIALLGVAGLEFLRRSKK